MNIVVLNQHYWPEIAATGQLLEDIAEDLVRAGHRVTVITGQPSYRHGQGGGGGLPSEEEHRGVRIRRVWSYVPEQRTIPRRVLHYASYFASSLVTALREEKPDVAMVLSTPPLLLGVSGVVAKAGGGIPFVYSVQDLYPDVAVNLGVLRPGRLTDAVDAVARRLYRAADQVVTLSDAMADRLREKGVSRERIHVIPNWADTDAVRPLPRDNAFARAHGFADTFTVQYSGNVGLSQGLEHVIEAARLLADLPVRFAIVGGGNARAALEAQAARHALKNVTFLDPQPRAELPSLLAASDVGLVPMKVGVAADLVPSKLYGILAAGRPVLASVEPNSEVARVIGRFDCGRVCAPEDPRALAQEIRDLFVNQARLDAMGARGRRAAEQHYSRRVCTTRYEEVLAIAADAGMSRHSGTASSEQSMGLRGAESPVGPS